MPLVKAFTKNFFTNKKIHSPLKTQISSLTTMYSSSFSNKNFFSYQHTFYQKQTPLIGTILPQNAYILSTSINTQQILEHLDLDFNMSEKTDDISRKNALLSNLNYRKPRRFRTYRKPHHLRQPTKTKKTTYFYKYFLKKKYGLKSRKNVICYVKFSRQLKKKIKVRSRKKLRFLKY